jgi:glycosyltransferase involved in cell wall biosynthesis
VALNSNKFTFLSHEVEGATGFPNAFAVYLQERGARLTYIRFPFFHSVTKSIWIEKWRGRELLSRRRSWFRFYQPQLLSFVKDFIWLTTTGWFYVVGSDFVLATNNLMGLAALILRKFGVVKRFTYLVIDYSPRRFQQNWVESVYVYLDRLIAENADSVWTMSKAMLDGREKDGRLDLAKVTYRIAPVGNNSHLTFAHGDVPYNKNHLVYVGNPNAKNVRADLLLEVAAKIAAKTSDFQLIFVGPGETAHLEQRARELGIERNVEFKGLIPDMLELERFLASCGVGLAPYDPGLADNFSKFADPAKIKTYLGSSLPVITTDVPEIAREVERRGAGFIAGFSPEKFAEKIFSLWSSDSAYVSARQAALVMGNEFAWPKIFDRLMREEGLA